MIIVIGRQPTVAAMRINAHITRFWRDQGDHAGDKASAHIGGYFSFLTLTVIAGVTGVLIASSPVPAVKGGPA